MVDGFSRRWPTTVADVVLERSRVRDGDRSFEEGLVLELPDDDVQESHSTMALSRRLHEKPIATQ